MPHSRPERTSFTSSWKRRRVDESAIVNWLAPPQNAGARRPGDAAVGHKATGDDASAELENLFHFGVADDGFAMFRVEQAGHRFLDLVDQFVNDRVKFDLDAFAFRGGHGLAFDFDVEADDDRIRGAGQQNVGFRNRPDTGVDDLEIDLLALDLVERAGERFERTLHVALQDDAQDVSCHRPLRARLSSVARCGMLSFSVALRRRRSSLKRLAARSDSITRNSSPASGRSGKAENLHGRGRAGFLDRLARDRRSSDFTLPP